MAITPLCQPLTTAPSSHLFVSLKETLQTTIIFTRPAQNGGQDIIITSFPFRPHHNEGNNHDNKKRRQAKTWGEALHETKTDVEKLRKALLRFC